MATRSRRLRWTALVLLAAVLLVLLALRLRYGGGEPYPDLSTEPLLPASALEVVAELDRPPGNLAVSADGRLFFDIHPESRPEPPAVLEWADGEAKPFPDAELQKNFTTVLGMVIDEQGRLWTLDTGFYGFDAVRLLAFAPSGGVVYDHVFEPDVAPRGSFLNDLQVSRDGGTVFIADVSFFRQQPALVVHNLLTGTSRRVLERHPSVTAQDWIIDTPLRRMTFFGGLIALKPGVDGIALSADGEWLVYGAMTHDGLFRVPVAALENVALSPAELAARVERIGTKPLSDGLSMDVEGNVYITDVEHQGIARMHPDGSLETLIRDPRVRWADGLSYGPDGWLYFTDSAIPDLMLRSRDHIEASAPYHIFRFRPGVEGVPGR